MSHREPDLPVATTVPTVRGMARAGRSTAPQTTIARDAFRARLVRRGLRLSYAAIGYNSLEGVLALAFGLAAGSIALVGFGADSLIELTASGAAVWRLWADVDPARRERAERRSLQIIGACFLALAAYVAADAGEALLNGEPPEASTIGIVLAAESLVVMPLLARAKRRVALAMGSRALAADAQQTVFCAYLSAVLAGPSPSAPCHPNTRHPRRDPPHPPLLMTSPRASSISTHSVPRRGTCSTCAACPRAVRPSGSA